MRSGGGLHVILIVTDARVASSTFCFIWKGGRFKPSEYAAANSLQRVNHFPKTTGITKKDCLLRNLRRMRATHGSIFAFFPESYILPTEYMTLVRNCELRPHEKPIWILKPTDSSQARLVHLTTHDPPAAPGQRTQPPRHHLDPP